MKKNKQLRTFIHKNTEPQHQLKGQEQYKNNGASKLEKIKNTELQQKLSGSYFKKKECIITFYLEESCCRRKHLY